MSYTRQKALSSVRDLLKFKTRVDQFYHYSETKSCVKVFVICWQIFLHLKYFFFQLKLSWIWFETQILTKQVTLVPLFVVYELTEKLY